LGLKKCTKSGGCQSSQKEVTLDANWRWLHKTGGYDTNCYEGNKWNKSVCPDPETCSRNCGLDGVPQDEWNNPYGIHSDGNELQLNFVTQGQYSKNIGSRTYMLNGEEYEMFQLLNQEFTFTVDVSNLPCGLNGALYFVSMDKTGNQGNGNMAGAKYGTGYCDAQCPRDVKFIDGGANVIDWDPNSQTGKWGSCCPEMDIWEANSISQAFTSHPCTTVKQKKCEDPVTCGENGHRYDGECDKDGCDLNAFRAGVKDFFGKGKTIDTNSKMTIVTQFLTDDNGDLKEIRRKFIQNGQVHEHPKSAIDSLSTQYDSITDAMCKDTKQVFGDTDDHTKKGGLKAMGDAMKDGMVLVMSLWDDHESSMLWLDSTFPTDKTTWGGPRGDCPTSSGRPEDVEANHPDANVKYSDIRIGDIDSTYGDLVYDTPPQIVQE